MFSPLVSRRCCVVSEAVCCGVSVFMWSRRVCRSVYRVYSQKHCVSGTSQSFTCAVLDFRPVSHNYLSIACFIYLVWAERQWLFSQPHHLCAPIHLNLWFSQTWWLEKDAELHRRGELWWLSGGHACHSLFDFRTSLVSCDYTIAPLKW